MFIRSIVQGGAVRALVVAITLASIPPQAAPAPDTPTLKTQLARTAAMPAAPRLSDQDFSRRASLNQVTLSPDGTWLAFLEQSGQAQALNVIDLRSGLKKNLLSLAGRQKLNWSSDSSMIFIDSSDALSVVAPAGGASSTIAAFDHKAEQQFVAIDPSHPRHALIGSYDSAAKSYRISRVGADGDAKVIYEGDKKAGEFLLDPAGQVAFMRTVDKDFSQVVWRKQGSKWVKATRCQRLRACQLVAASADGRLLTMIVNHQDERKALVQLDLAASTTRVLHSDPLALADLQQAVVSPLTRRPLFAVYDLPVRRNFGLTAASRRAGADIAARFPESDITIGAGETAPRWLLTERSARLSQDRFWLYDLASGRIVSVLEQERSAGQPLPEQHLARKIPLHYRASDGALLHGYLSLPAGKKAATLPMVTMVHAGPWDRAGNGYTSLVQMLVNRGFAVFQPNFRASTGYGHNYMSAPRSDFGNGRVQADIIDGVRWLLANGVGDKNRLAIMGDSFGGYSTLQALTHTPNMFRFGMAMVPPPDFSRTIAKAAAGPAYGDEPPFSVMLSEMGIDTGNAAAMKKIADQSPAANASKVIRPLLILAGGKDHLVDAVSVTGYAAKLNGLKRPVTLLLDPEEGHSPRKPMFRAAYSHLLQRMLHEHLGGPAPAAPSAELAVYLEKVVELNTALKPLAMGASQSE